MLLSNRYQVLGVLGDGGFGKTFLVEDTQMPSGRKCVLKQLKPIRDNPEIHQMVKERFQREAAILEKLGDNHPQIPRLYAYFSEADQFYLVEEWIEGETVMQRVQREGRQSEAIVREILIRLLPVVTHVHQQGIVHRDIKPDNIVLRYPDRIPVLIDFGAVKETMSTIMNSQGNSSHSIVIGTPGYMPSEQLAGRPVFASDLYSLGMTAIFMLTGKIPQELPTDPATGSVLWHNYAPEVSPEMAALIDRAIHVQLHVRYGTAQEMLMALNQSLIATQTPPSYAQIPQLLATGMNTTVAAPGNPSVAHVPSTQAVSAAQSYSSSPSIAPSSNWKKAVIIGGITGASTLLGGTILLRSQILGFLGSSPPIAQVSAPSSSPASTSNPPTNDSASTNKTSPQFDRSQPPSSNVSQTALNQPEQPAKLNPSENSANTNATIIGDRGTKNIRSGPGTNYPVALSINTGDRVQVVEESRDSDGFTWYKIYSPSMGTTGWIASQLVHADSLSANKPSQPDSKPNLPSQSNPDTNVSSSTEPTVHTGYCTSLATNQGKNIVNDRCSIHDYKNGSYKLMWSNGKVSDIRSYPSASVDSTPASIVKSEASSMTVQWTEGKIGFCWNCSP